MLTTLDRSSADMRSVGWHSRNSSLAFKHASAIALIAASET